ncbi:MAG: hypothetical protein HOK52_14975 [Candidatus Marinimicrobia bacterium]|jgi:hypothetical protein|nr:hypothetical protein [Candidatus Neomarinimicrobiota bacterium]
MTSTTIYTPITPTFLYIKQHSITGKKYFGKTTRDPYTYPGSGLHWKRHIKKHGKEFVETLWVSEPYYDTNITEIALQLSIENNIVESNLWANLILENGLDGGFGNTGKKHSEESKAKISDANTGSKRSDETKAKMSAAKNHISDETRAKLSAANKGVAQEIVHCPHCSKSGGLSLMKRWHFDNCKSKISSL